jgi:hypothetical protein
MAKKLVVGKRVSQGRVNSQSSRVLPWSIRPAADVRLLVLREMRRRSRLEGTLLGSTRSDVINDALREQYRRHLGKRDDPPPPFLLLPRLTSGSRSEPAAFSN